MNEQKKSSHNSNISIAREPPYQLHLCFQSLQSATPYVMDYFQAASIGVSSVESSGDHSLSGSTYSSTISTPYPPPETSEQFMNHELLDYQWSYESEGDETVFPRTSASPTKQFTDHGASGAVESDSALTSTGLEFCDSRQLYAGPLSAVRPESILRSAQSYASDDPTIPFFAETLGSDAQGIAAVEHVEARNQAAGPLYYAILGYEGSNAATSISSLELPGDGAWSRRTSRSKKRHLVTQLTPLAAPVEWDAFNGWPRETRDGSSASTSASPKNDIHDDLLSPLRSAAIAGNSITVDQSWEPYSASNLSNSVSRDNSLPPSQPQSPERTVSSKSQAGRAGDYDDRSRTICTNCSTQNTPLWRRDVKGLPMCNACGLFLKLHGISRPLSLKTDVIKKLNRDSIAGSVSPNGISTRAAKRPNDVSSSATVPH